MTYDLWIPFFQPFSHASPCRWATSSVGTTQIWKARLQGGEGEETWPGEALPGNVGVAPWQCFPTTSVSLLLPHIAGLGWQLCPPTILSLFFDFFICPTKELGIDERLDTSRAARPWTLPWLHGHPSQATCRWNSSDRSTTSWWNRAKFRRGGDPGPGPEMVRLG